MSNRQVKHLIKIGMYFFGGFVLIFLAGYFYLPEKYHLETEVVVPRTTEKVWEWFLHPENWNKRFSIVQSVEETVTKERGVGEELKIEANLVKGEKLTSKLVITDWKKGRLISDRHLGDWLNDRPLPLINVHDKLEFKPAGDNNTKIIFNETFNVKGPVNKWLAYLFVKPAADRLMARIIMEYNLNLQKNPAIHG